ncbi:small multidrug resistance protein [Pycnococcus provasolii]
MASSALSRSYRAHTVHVCAPRVHVSLQCCAAPSSLTLGLGSSLKGNGCWARQRLRRETATCAASPTSGSTSTSSTSTKAAATATASSSAPPHVVPNLEPRASDWMLLAAAIVLEVVGTTCMKLVSMQKEMWMARLFMGAVALCYVSSFSIFIHALKRFEISTAYAIWSGAGTALTAVVGFAFFSESLGVGKVAAIGMIIAGVVGVHAFQ